MNKTKNDIKSLFESYHPELSDSEEFISRLENRLDQVDEVLGADPSAKPVRQPLINVSRTAATSNVNYWRISIIAFLIGAAAGAFVLFLLLFKPESLTQCRLYIEGVMLRFFAFRQVFFAALTLVAALLVLVPILRSRRHVTVEL